MSQKRFDGFLCSKTILTLLVTVAASFPAAAQNSGVDDHDKTGGSITEPQSGLTLPIAVDIALRTNPLIRATTTGSEIARAQILEARSARLPVIQLNETFTRSNNPVFVFGSLLEQGRFASQNFALRALNSPDPINNFRSSVVFRLPLFDQRQADTRISEAKIGGERAAARTDMTRQQIRYEVLTAFYGVLLARARKGVADEAVTMAEADVKRVRDLFEQGLVVASDLLAVQVQMAEFRQQQAQSAGDLHIAGAALNTALGLPLDTPVNVRGELSAVSFDIAPEDRLIRTALSNRPELADSRLKIRSSRERARGARGEFLPRVDLFGGFGVSGNGLARGSSDYTFGASVTFNILDSGRKARLAQARAAEALAEAEQDHLVSRVRLEVVRAYHQFVSARERVSLADQVVAQAEEALRIVRDRYQEGLTTVTEVLRAETTLVRARVTLLGARHDHLVGFASLLLSTGTLTGVERFV
jgi:outer membrane protein TolC